MQGVAFEGRPSAQNINMLIGIRRRTQRRCIACPDAQRDAAAQERERGREGVDRKRITRDTPHRDRFRFSE